MLNVVPVAERPLPTTNPTYADLLVDFIEQMGIEYVFGVPGGAIEPFYDAMARSERRGGPKMITARHESGAAFMADGYYRETGKMGVVCSTTGPGATNLITGVSSALADGIPMLVITAQTALPKFGRRALQDSSCSAMDTVSMLKQCTTYNTLISHPEQLQGKLINAIMHANRGAKGPVHLSVPSDLLRMTSEPSERFHVDLLTHNFTFVDFEAIETLCRKIDKVDTMAVYIDGRVQAASQEVVRFCELTNTPFVVGLTGKYWVDETHPLYRGVYGFAGHLSAKSTLEAGVDLILAVGAEWDEMSTGGWDRLLLNTKLVHIDSDLEHFARSAMANLHVAGDIKATFMAVNRHVAEVTASGKVWRCCTPAETLQQNVHGGYAELNEQEVCTAEPDNNAVKPQQLMWHLTQTLNQDTRIFIDAGNIWSWMTHFYCNRSQSGLLRSGMGLGAMTWSLGSAIGSALGDPSKSTICIVGDGAYLMSAQEITVAQQHQLPIVFVVLNDSAYGMVMHGQQLGQAEEIGWQLSEVNYAQVADAMGVRSLRVTSGAELASLDLNALALKQGPTLVDIIIDRTQIPPMAQRVKGLAPKTPGG